MSKESLSKKLLITGAVALVFGTVSGVSFQGVRFGTDFARQVLEESYHRVTEDEEESKKGSESVTFNTEPVSSSQGSVTLDYDVADIAEKTQTSIVSINTTVVQNVEYFFQTYQQEATGAGSGIIIGQDDDKLYIATNYHVIQGANAISVGFCDGEMAEAKVTGYDEDADIAVVEMDLSTLKDSTRDAITVAKVGNSDEIKVGEPAIAIGNALGYGQSVTVGYISALDRTIAGSEKKYIQTDAAINPGNSGGALINSKGEVIGINSVKYVDSQVEGMGFSIPINTAMELINGIISGEKKHDIELGISGVEITKEYNKVYGFPMGVYIRNVEAGSPASNAGLRQGDIIVEFNGDEVYTVEELEKKLSQCKDGDTVEVVISRPDEFGYYGESKVEVTLTP